MDKTRDVMISAQNLSSFVDLHRDHWATVSRFQMIAQNSQRNLIRLLETSNE